MTLVELARELNVSIATISRALNHPEDVAPATRERVLSALHRNGHQRSARNHSLRSLQARTIGVIISDIRNPFFAAFVRLVQDRAQANGYHVIICNADEDRAKEEAAFHLLRDRKVAGVINCCTGASLELLDAFRRSGAILVDFDRESGLVNIDSVTVDNEAGSAAAVRHFLQLGHRRIAIIAGPQHLSNARYRLSGFGSELARNGLSLSRDLVQVGDFLPHSGYEAGARLFRLKLPPTAIFVSNLEMAAGLIEFIRENDIRVPEQVSVVSFDDAFWARYIDPPLTVIAQPIDRMARYAIDLLLMRLRGVRGPERKRFKPKLIVRASCGSPVSGVSSSRAARL